MVFADMRKGSNFKYMAKGLKKIHKKLKTSFL